MNDQYFISGEFNRGRSNLIVTDQTLSLANDEFNELDSDFDTTQEYHYIEADDFLAPATSTAGEALGQSDDKQVFGTVTNIGLAVYDCKFIFILYIIYILI